MSCMVLKIVSKTVFATLKFLGNLVLFSYLFSEIRPHYVGETYYVDRLATKLFNPVSAS